MGRNLGRVGGASAGVIAVIFGILELLQKTPPPWLPIALGAVAIFGVLADYLWEQRGASDAPTTNVNQNLQSGRGSQNVQSGRDTSDVRFDVGGGPEEPK